LPIVFVALGPVIIVAIFVSDQRPPVLVGAAFLLVALLALWSWMHDRLQARRLVKMQSGRPPLDANVFAEAFRDHPQGAKAAIAVRDLLQEHTGLDLSRLRPDDPLDDLRDYLDPIFFDELGQKLGFAAPANHLEFQALVSPLKTMRDLVDVVASRLGG
jgi:hypothetical protein